MKISFEGRRVLITGAGKGLGRALAEKFYESGAKVFALDVDQSLLEELKKVLPNITPVCVDLSDWDATRAAVESCGPLDHLVNNAVAFLFSELLELPKEHIEKATRVNVNAIYNICQVFAKNAIKHQLKDATIVNLSSAATAFASPISALYTANKAALESITRSFAVELGPHGIRVNAIAPGGMPTTLMAGLPDNLKAEYGKYAVRQPIQGYVELEDSTNLILYLSSTSSKMITGQVVRIDGGISIA